MNVAKTLGELTAGDLGRNVTVTSAAWACSGTLREFNTRPLSEVEEYSGGSAFPEILRGPTVVDLTVGPWEAEALHPDTECVVSHA